MKRFITGTILLCILCLKADEKVDGYIFPDKVKAGKIELVFNGGGTRKKMFVKIYNSALYLETKQHDDKAVTYADKPMAVIMHFEYSLVSKEKIISVWNECFKNVTNGKVAPIKKEIDLFCQFFAKEDVKKGDVFELIYTSKNGLKVIKNSKNLGSVKGLPFKKALFSVWFGDKPIQNDLKNTMLGK